jgi:hypothetical protein
VVERASRAGVAETVEWEAGGATMGSDGGWPVTAMPLTSWSSPPRSGVEADAGGVENDLLSPWPRRGARR